MERIFVTADDLYLSLSMAPLQGAWVGKSSFSIDVNLLYGGKVQSGSITLSNRDTLLVRDAQTLLLIAGTISINEEEPLVFTGICDKNVGYEECYLLVVEPEIFESNITQTEFISLAKKYCKSRNISVQEDGNIASEGFNLFESIPTDHDAPPPRLLARNRADIEIYTIMCDDFFPIMHSKKSAAGSKLQVSFGKFITENTIKVFTREQLYAMRKKPIFV